MPKPMYCPMSFANPQMLTAEIDNEFPWLKPSIPKMECTPDCAWAVFDYKEDCYACGLVEVNTTGVVGNWRQLEDDAE